MFKSIFPGEEPIAPPGSTVAPPGSAVAPPGSTGALPGCRAAPPGSTVARPGSAGAPLGSTVIQAEHTGFLCGGQLEISYKKREDSGFMCTWLTAQFGSQFSWRTANKEVEKLHLGVHRGQKSFTWHLARQLLWNTTSNWSNQWIKKL